MSTLPDTLYLNPDTWDLQVDGLGNIQTAGTPYAQAQDVASACRLWLGEALYDTSRGLPYQTVILGELPPPGLVSALMKIEAETVNGVASALVSLTYSAQTRGLTGSVSLTLDSGVAVMAGV
jgi:hypothetical protein